MRRGLPYIFLSLLAAPVCSAQTGGQMLDINASGCEKMIGGESKSSARIRATDKAVFAGLKKLRQVSEVANRLDSHEANLFVYRLADEYVENLTVKSLAGEDDRVCVEVRGMIDPQNISAVKTEFLTENKPETEPETQAVEKAAREVMAEVAVKPADPESLALVYIDDLSYYNGAKTAKFVPELKNRFADNPYFYLTDQAELADYKLTPKVLKAKVDSLDAGHKRLQMVVSIDIAGVGDGVVNEYQNRFVLFGAEENEQQIASRLIKKLLENAGDGAVRKIERSEQLKIEKKALGKTLSE